MSEPLLLLRDVAVGYDQWPIISGLSLTVRLGGISAVVGPNAGGKTTLFRGLFAHADAWLRGILLWNGLPVSHLRASAIPTGAVAWVRQDRPVFQTLSVEEALKAAMVKGDRNWRRSRLSELYDTLPELREVAAQKMRTLSGGERALVSLAVGLVNQPTLLCLDEPAANLDVPRLARVRALLLDYVRKGDTGCLLIEHRETFVDGLGEIIHLPPRTDGTSTAGIAAPS